MTSKTYHIYLEDKCLFKNLNESEFDIIWGRLYRSYWNGDITYSVITDTTKEMANTYEGVSNSLTGLVGSQDASTNAGDNLQRMNANLDSLNNMYEMQLEQLKENKALFDGMGNLVKTLNDSVEDTKAYKEHSAELAQNLATLNTVYGNMLNAMGGSRS